MAVTMKTYGQQLKTALNKEIDWDTDSIKVMLCTALTINQDTPIYLADVTKTEVASGGGYTTGGKQLTFGSATAIAYNGTTNTITIDADDVVWTSATITASYAIIYDDTPVTNKPVIAYVDFGKSQATVSGTFTITWPTAGIATIVVS